MLLELLGDGSAFKVRAAALIVRDGRILLNQVRSGDCWMLPGGTGEFGESSDQTLRRELREELGVEASVGRLLWVVEHFFGTDARRWHQLLWIHEAALPPDCDVVRCETWEAPAPGEDRFRWTPVPELRGLRLLPGFLAAAVTDLPRDPRHIVHVDRAPPQTPHGP